MRREILDGLTKIVNEQQIKVNEPMCLHTTFRVGGPCDVLVQPSVDQVAPIICFCQEMDVPYVVIGNGSNILVGDAGIRGVVIEIGKNAADIRIEGTHLYIEAGALLSKAANLAMQHSLTGMEFAAGIPGSIGGAVVMNAGAYGGEMKQILVNARVLTSTGEEKVLTNEELDLSYRHSIVMDQDMIVLAAELELAKGNRETIETSMKELRDKRVEKQPLEYPSAGSTFKRPEGYFAGKLIMDAGLRGYQVGGAQVSEKHCGFVINRGEATAADIVTLMQDVSDKVREQFGVELEPEVRKLGDFS